MFDTDHFNHDWRLAFVDTISGTVQLQTVPAHMTATDTASCTLTVTLTNARSNEAGDAMLIPSFILFPFDIIKNYRRQTITFSEAELPALLSDHVFKTLPRPANYIKNSIPRDLVSLLHCHTYIIKPSIPSCAGNGIVSVDETVYAGMTRGERGAGLEGAQVTCRFHMRNKVAHLSMIKVTDVAIVPLSTAVDVVFGPPPLIPTMPTPMTVAKALTDDEYLDSIQPFPAAVITGRKKRVTIAPTVGSRRSLRRKDERQRIIPIEEEHDVDGMVTDISKVNMSEEDIAELQNTFHFTDNVLHQMLLRAISAVPAIDLADVYVFSALLMAQLDRTTVPPRCRGPDERIAYIFHDRVIDYASAPAAAGAENGKRQSCLLGKKYIFIPVNANTHWALYMFYRPFEPDAPEPIAYVFDSMYSLARGENNAIPFSVHHMLLTYAGLYLKNVAEYYSDTPGGASLINFDRKNRIVRVPQQPFRSNACGLYVCEFVRHLLVSKENRDRFIEDVTADSTTPVFAEEFEGFNDMTMHQVKQEVLTMLEEDLTVANKRRKRG